MKFWPLLLAGLWRRPERTLLNGLCVAAAFVVFGLLQGINAGFAEFASSMRPDRLLVEAKVGNGLPISHVERIRTIPGIIGFAHDSMFAGYFQDEKNNFPVYMTYPEEYFRVYPELRVPRAQLDTLMQTHMGALIGAVTMKKYGWKIGDRISLHSRAAPRIDGTSDWPFEIVGIFETSEALAGQGFGEGLIGNYAYFDEARSQNRGTVGWYLLRVQKAAQAVQISSAIDKVFANSSAETRTQTESQLSQPLDGGGPLGLFSRAIMIVGFVIILVAATVTNMQSVRERTSEFGVLKALGFSNAHLQILIVAESVILFVTAALIGLGIAALLTKLEFVANFIPGGYLRGVVVLWGTGAAVLVAIVCSLAPVWRAGRLNAVAAIQDAGR